MNNVAMAQAVQAAAKPKFRGHDTLKSKVKTYHPAGLEREYTRVVNAYMAALKAALSKHLPTIRRAIDAEREGFRRDSDSDVLALIESEFLKVHDDLNKKMSDEMLEIKTLNLSEMARDLKIREWKRLVHKTLGIDIFEDYYKGEFFRNALQRWTTNNVNLIKTIPKNTLASLMDIVREGYLSGASNATIGKGIKAAYDIDYRHAQFIARDQIAKLNAEITRTQQQDAGVEEYIWSSSGDGRVRDCHVELDGKKFKWSDPPEMWYLTKKGRVNTGERCHPGEWYQCRCVALPVFNLPGLVLPWEKDD